MSDAARQTLVEGLAELALPASPEQIAALLELASRVESWGRRMNLSGHRSRQEVVERLILDAVALLATAPAFDSLADLGSGAGFPGLPIAILRPDARVTLVEARLRRHHFQRAVRRELDLANVEPLRGRAEALEPRPHGAVVAQALARPERAIRWMLPWAEPGGWLLLPAAERGPELKAAAGFAFDTLRRYRVPGSEQPRTLWIGRRTA